MYQQPPTRQAAPAPAEGTVNIRGKVYTTVARRSELAHAAGGYSMLASEILPLGDTGRLFYRVTIAIGEKQGQQYIGSAEIKLNAKPGTPDADAPIECAETSALGRALGFAGFASAEAIASADEVRRVS